MVDILGACERILKTPVPYSYSMFLKKFIFLYVITLPIGFVATFDWWSVPVVMLVFYILVSVELIAEEIEDPFGVDENDLPLDGLCETIEANVQEVLGRD
jgi:putative membrane protein